MERVYAVYVLESDQRKLYVGMTSDVTRRIAQHQKGEGAQSRKLCKDPSAYRVLRVWLGLSMEDAARLEAFMQTRTERQARMFVKKFEELLPEFRSLWEHRKLGDNYTYLKNKQNLLDMVL